MFWLWLFPFRWTTEPPRLPPHHPLRRYFQAHGTATARYWRASLGLVIVVTVLLCYQIIFQVDSSAAATLRNLPKHVWTSTTEVVGERVADVVVRQVWVHGDYMNATNLPVMREALLVQRALIGSGFGDNDAASSVQHHPSLHDVEHCVTARAGEKWGWHSPLMYWNCSLSALEKDHDLLATINAHVKSKSALNITLRPSTVFAGKTFSGTKLRAADALVITLFDRTDSGLGDVWNARSKKLVGELLPDWAIFPSDGQILRNHLYEFRFRPMTLNDDLLLAASYFITAAYVVWRMKQLRAVKSWAGLLVTICVKMTICVLASFTLCTYLGINLTRIPRPWFPLVVFCFGLGNIFRLINVVLETPPEMPPHQRIGTALGEVGHLSLAVAFQNLVLIYLCSRLVTPWVVDFCVFAAVTLVIDLIYHLTFFVAVLSVDVQRLELSDSLERVDLNKKTKNRGERRSWLAALLEGKLPLSTRFAGTVAFLSIIVAINLHFFDSNEVHFSWQSLRQGLPRLRRKDSDSIWSPPPINQARTPAEWLRIQDHNTAGELFSLIKPGSESFVARIYDPLLVVSKGAHGRDRTPPPATITEGIRRFAQDHAFPAALIVVFLIAGVTLLVNYLLYTGLPETLGDSEDDDTFFFVRTLPNTQVLDVVQLTSCTKGHLSSISLDRSTTVWLHSRVGYLHNRLNTATMKSRLWPINGSVMDEAGTMLALCGDSGQIGLFDLKDARPPISSTVDLRGQSPVLFTFVNLTRDLSNKIFVIILLPDGRLFEIDATKGEVDVRQICLSPILYATLHTSAKADHSLVFVSETGEVQILSLKDRADSSSEVVAGLDPGSPLGSNPSKIKSICGVPSLGLIFALRDEEAEIFEFSSRVLIHTFKIGHVKPQSFRVMHSARRQCICGAPAVLSLTVAYAERKANHMLMQTFLVQGPDNAQICLGKPADRNNAMCKGLGEAVHATRLVEPAGVWDSTNISSVLGIRQITHVSSPSSASARIDETSKTNSSAPVESAVAKRAREQSPPNGLVHALDPALSPKHPRVFGDADTWEAWMLASNGEFRTRPLVPDDLDEPIGAFNDDLLVTTPGPIVRLGKRSVAVGYGNVVKIISLGRETLEGLSTMDNGIMDFGLGAYNWRARRSGTRKAS